MGRAAVRADIQQFLQSAQIPFLGSVYPARPAILPEDAYTRTMSGQAILESVNGSAAVAVVNLPSEARKLQAFTGRAAIQDVTVHNVVVELFFASTCGEGIAAQQDYDTIVDAFIVAVRGNPSPGGLWSVGEEGRGVEHAQSEPYQADESTAVLIVGNVSFEAWEWVAGTPGAV